MLEWLCPLLGYLTVSGLITLVARQAVDPYGHFTPGQDWRQAIFIGAFWPILLLYAIGVGVYYTYFRKD